VEQREHTSSPVGLLTGMLAVIVVVAGVVGVLSATRRNGPAAGSSGLLAASVVAASAHTAHLLCPSSAAFSPDGTQLAVIGASMECRAAADSFVGHALAVYDARTGTLTHDIPLDPLIGYDPLLPRALQRIGAVRYVGLGWSPDGTRVAVAYTTFSSATQLTFSRVVSSGLLLVDVTTGTAATVPGDAGFFTTAPGTYAGLPIWQLVPQSVTPPFTPQPGLTFAWSNAGQPSPIIPLGPRPLTDLPMRAGPRYPVGNPDGDSVFTIWQPGVVLGTQLAGASAGHAELVSAFPSWSATGSDVTMLVTAVTFPAPASNGTSADALPDDVVPPVLPMPTPGPVVPARDAALTAVAAEVGANGWAQVAWNPSGAELASVNCLAPSGPTLEVRDTQTGQVIGSAAIEPSGLGGCRQFNGAESLGDYPNPNLTLLWSPDGSHIAVADEAASAVILWSVQPRDSNP
jgi:WD40 repeat protein